MTTQHDNTSNEAPASTRTDETTSPGVTTPESPQNGPEGDSRPANREARYRVERNEARGERDALQARIERMQRADIERLASDALSQPGDLFTLSGNTVADYLTDGDVDAEKVAADVAVILAERPGLRTRPPSGFDPSQGTGGRPSPKGEPSWGGLLKS